MSGRDDLRVEEAIQDAQKRRNGHRVSQAQLRELDTLALLMGTPSPLAWVAEGVDAEGALTMMGGREKSGKSLLEFGISSCAASGGGSLAGIAIAPAKTLIIDAENGEREIHRRLHAIGLDPVFAKMLVIVEVRGFELREDLDRVVDLIDRHRPDRVVMDSFRSLWRGDEHDNAEVAEALDPVRALSIRSEDDDGPVSIEKAEPYKRPKPRDEKSQAVLDALTGDVQSEREIAAESDVPRSTAQRILRDLEAAGMAKREAGGWVAHLAHPLYRSGPPGPPDEGDG